MSKADRTTEHTKLVDAIRLALGREPGLVLWPNAVKHVEYFTKTGTTQHMRTGLAPGSSDLVGLLEVEIGGRKLGRFLGLEAKTGNAVAKPHQDLWLELVRSRGGFATVVHSVDEARSAIARARTGALE